MRARRGEPTTVLAFDFGLRRIGVAVGNTLTSAAEPLATLAARRGVPDWDEVAHCFAEWHPGVVVVGVPCNMDDSPGPLTAAARAFAAELSARFGVPVEGIDERLSSREAGQALKERRQSGALRRRVRRGDVDREAACVLLRQWLAGR
jgi:putative Holliday junction resolvase